MTRRISVLLVLLLIPGLACAEFSESSSAYDPALAQWALQIAELCSTPVMQEGILKLVEDGTYLALGEKYGLEANVLCLLQKAE